jgi:hypothetical protein
MECGWQRRECLGWQQEKNWRPKARRAWTTAGMTAAAPGWRPKAQGMEADQRQHGLHNEPIQSKRLMLNRQTMSDARSRGFAQRTQRPAEPPPAQAKEASGEAPKCEVGRVKCESPGHVPTRKTSERWPKRRGRTKCERFTATRAAKRTNHGLNCRTTSPTRGRRRAMDGENNTA